MRVLNQTLKQIIPPAAILLDQFDPATHWLVFSGKRLSFSALFENLRQFHLTAFRFNSLTICCLTLKNWLSHFAIPGGLAPTVNSNSNL